MSKKGKWDRSLHPEICAAKSEMMRKITARRWAEDPEGTRAISVQNGTTATSYLWECDECARQIRGPAIGYHHQKATGHQGRTLIERQETPS